MSLPRIPDLSASRQNFTQVVPRTRPVAETALLQAGVAARQGDTARAVELCHVGAALLRELRSGTDPVLLEPCLAAFAAEAGRRAGERQVLLAEMFETAELAQDSVTSREIDEAAARLAANARDPKVAEAIRRRQDAEDKLAELYRQRDPLAGNAPPGTLTPGPTGNPAALDRQITDAQAELADADAALQAAAPNYGQLVQQVVPAADVLSALRPDEALISITLSKHAGWSFLLRAGAIDAAPVKGRCGDGHRAGPTGAGQHRIADRYAADVRYRGRTVAVRRHACAGGHTAQRRDSAGGRAVQRVAVAAISTAC